MVTPGYPPDGGGVEQHVGHLAPQLVQLGFEVDVLTQGDHSDTRLEVSGDLRVVRFPLTMHARHSRASLPMWRYLRSHAECYTVVHAHNYHALPALFAAMSLWRAFVLTPHYHGDSAGRVRQILHHAYKIPGRRMVEHATRVICVSAAEADLVGRHFPAAAERISVIANGVDRARLAAASAFDGYDRRLVLTVGRLDGYKRVDRALEAVAELPCMVLHVIGQGEARVSLEQRAEDLGMADRVRFLGRVSDQELARWYKSAAVVLSLSEHEAFGLVAAEALTAGAAVVLSDIPAHGDVAKMGDTSRVRLVGPHASASEVAQAIEAVAGTAPGVSRVPDWIEVARLTADVYDEVRREGGIR
jgi:glycosyltransferase involved in cell wall biosynthesis